MSSMKFTFDHKGQIKESTEGNDTGVAMHDSTTGVTQVINPNADVIYIGEGRQWFEIPPALGGGRAYVQETGQRKCPICSENSTYYILENMIILVICFKHENPYLWGKL